MVPIMSFIGIPNLTYTSIISSLFGVGRYRRWPPSSISRRLFTRSDFTYQSCSGTVRLNFDISSLPSSIFRALENFSFRTTLKYPDFENLRLDICKIPHSTTSNPLLETVLDFPDYMIKEPSTQIIS